MCNNKSPEFAKMTGLPTRTTHSETTIQSQTQVRRPDLTSGIQQAQWIPIGCLQCSSTGTCKSRGATRLVLDRASDTACDPQVQWKPGVQSSPVAQSCRSVIQEGGGVAKKPSSLDSADQAFPGGLPAHPCDQIGTFDSVRGPTFS